MEVVSQGKLECDVIKPIGKDAVHRICSGQVVLSLAIAVKELIENAIDAEAKIIDIRLNNYGADLIEVRDNGSGVLSDNFQALTLKHYTSKLREFSDLENIGTLGFRGEALSSLCALANLSIITRHSSTEIGSKIIYDHNGKIKEVKPMSREIGTTVVLENLFSTLPVRRKEFMKNLKREFNKMCQLLYAYCLVCKGIKFNCTNISERGSKSTIVVTEGQSTVRENILSIFGPKQISSLIEIELVRPEEPILSEYGITLTPGESLPFHFEFFISSAMHGSGRSSTDRQFFFINSRPCEPTKVTKLINEIYKQYNANQYPFVYLNITTQNSIVDVNVTPDKRQIFLEKEKYLLATVKASLIEAFKAFPSTYKVQNIGVSKSFPEAKKSIQDSSKSLKRSVSEAGIKKGSILEVFGKRSKLDQDYNKHLNINSDIPQNNGNDVEFVGEDDKKDSDKKELDCLVKIACKLIEEKKLHKIVDHVKMNEISDTSASELSQEDIKLSLDVPVKSSTNKKYVFMKTSISAIREALALNPKKDDTTDVKVRFRSQIAPESNKTAEEELQKQISKEDFKRMSIIGQFNLGFIVTRLNNDLFIIDQHATDEKYNFEQLQSTTVLENQKLVSPKVLELTAGNECLLIENEKVFNKNGFTFKIDHTAPCTKKVSLTAIPMSKSFVFGKDDIDEMLFMLQDSSDHSCIRPSRVRAMFASRACRKSVMIGKPLSVSDMRKLVDHMSEIDQPWNCPHGRPTMRHLINLDLLQK